MASLLFLTAVILSGIAAYYSVIGLIAIFSAATIPVAIMGGSLEAAKLVVASWLYRYWRAIPLLMKVYFTFSLVILMLITSMGIFGFLSKAHSDQSLVGGDVVARLSIYDEKIKTAKDNVEANRRALKQMDEAVDQVMARSTTEGGADKAVNIRRSQAKERARLQTEIAAEQRVIAKLNEESAPIRAEIRKVEAEVGPLKYIASLIYGDNPDENMLERSVRWLIILLICVFDPLAVLMLIAANLTQIKSKEIQGEKTDDKQTETVPNQTELPVVIEAAKEQDAPTIDAEKVEPSIQPSDVVEAVGVEPPAADPSKKPKKTRTKKVKELEQEPKPETVNAPGLDASIERPGDYLTSVDEPVKLEEQSLQYKSIEDDYFNKGADEVIDKMIETGDQDGLETVYKKIVKELAKKNRTKSTHWGPLRTK